MKMNEDPYWQDNKYRIGPDLNWRSNFKLQF